MRNPASRHDRLGRFQRSLDGLLGTGNGRRSRWAWSVPVAVLIGTVLAFVVIGAITEAPLEVSLPNGAIIALVMSVLTVACMSPSEDDSGGDDPPRDDGDGPVIGSPGGPWVVVAHLGPAPSSSRVTSDEQVLVGTHRQG